MSELDDFARGYRSQLRELEGQFERLRTERDKVIRRVYKAGVPIVAIADALGLSHQRVSKIVRVK